jgi:acetylornithine deacetylase/succinyl-diaminopimelate desuccinylase-like protein
LAHIDVVEAKREDWKTDPFKLQEKDGVFTARGAIDDKAMAGLLYLGADAAQARGLCAESGHHPGADG